MCHTSTRFLSFPLGNGQTTFKASFTGDITLFEGFQMDEIELEINIGEENSVRLAISFRYNIGAQDLPLSGKAYFIHSNVYNGPRNDLVTMSS